MIFTDKNFLVLGIAKSGISSAKLLLSQNANVYFYDDFDDENVRKAREELKAEGCVEISKNDIETEIKKIYCVIISPGVAIDSYCAGLARKNGIRIIGEIELGHYFNHSVFLAITGTNGKTTTCSMLHAILLQSGKNSELIGNVGTPVTAKTDKLIAGNLNVIEVSSFQLESTFLFCPHVAALLNITSDHLNRHYSMENYIFVKSRIFNNMRESEYAVLNNDCKNVISVADKIKAKKIFFSAKGEVNGAYVNEGSIYYMKEYIMKVEELSLKESYNIENALAAVCFAKLLNIDNNFIAEALGNFKGVKHRMQFVKEADGVKFYNDSKGTNIDSTLKAAQSLTEPTVLLLGGSEKGYDYDELFEKLKLTSACGAVLYGETKLKMAESAKKANFDNIIVCNTFENSIKIAKTICPKNGNVLLSPASASFDMFKNYEERGDRFVEIVEGF